MSDEKDNTIYIKFNGNKATYDPKRNVFLLTKENFKIDFDNFYGIDEELKEKFKKLHFVYAELKINRSNGFIHYAV